LRERWAFGHAIQRPACRLREIEGMPRAFVGPAYFAWSIEQV
jgi:hypothetical protein